ncbi:MAG: fumarylacetoacetate hydrolase family protein [SAR202 cluster bacterium]|jgi:2-dehydro-3-deoxy-D-arabinonate dehydratase|nr:fumarylacetoacetate hydrolase family protein [SAR202 cluster bacterium]
MKFYRLIDYAGSQRLAVENGDGQLYDLTSTDDDIIDVEELVRASSLSGVGIDALTGRLLEGATAETHNLAQLIEDSRNGSGEFLLDRPFDPPEVWAAGVTYKSSEMERRRESDTPDVYSKVYAAKRPELFLKATSERCLGPFESVGIRPDSAWNVPEPELAFVTYQGEIVGYTIGNDMSSRSIEGENPLYLPQAKVYDRSCAIGPCFVTPEAIDPHDLSVRCIVSRDRAEVFSGETSTSLMARTCEELSDWLHRHNTIPNMTAVLTGTPVVPPPDFTLAEGDIVTIEIQGIGMLENDVVVV